MNRIFRVLWNAA
ncbi:hypothetical protein JF949_23185, partial [Salmonella enterica subsp. enterica serovar Derby]|nr:hypothetical protein [Salmonella enterica subsp. enterica serovar Derby]